MINTEYSFDISKHQGPLIPNTQKTATLDEYRKKITSVLFYGIMIRPDNSSCYKSINQLILFFSQFYQKYLFESKLQRNLVV